MKDKKYKYSVSASIPPEVLHRLYERLEDEATPYRLTIRKINKEARKAGNTHLVVFETDDRAYFSAMLADCKQK